MNKILNISLVAVLFLTQSCENKTSTDNTSLPKPSVSIVNPILGEIQENIQINGQVLYLNKTKITAPISGYINSVNTILGNKVKKGNILFTIQTKESKALQNAHLSTSNQFGIIAVYAPVSGYIDTINIPDSGVFINVGSDMATIVKKTDLVIQVNTPFQYRTLLKNTKSIEIKLPNQEIMPATFYKARPVIDPVSQTQQVFFKLNNYASLPENLNVIVKIPTKEKKNITVLPKDVVLTNETQDEFWIMKVTKDSLAIKVPVIKGLENNKEVEILTPLLKLTDAIIQKGAYGLPDSTKVKIK